jgi:hypothetical protein
VAEEITTLVKQDGIKFQNVEAVKDIEDPEALEAWIAKPLGPPKDKSDQVVLKSNKSIKPCSVYIYVQLCV